MMKGALVVLLASLVATSSQMPEEPDPVCFSRYDYDVKMLGKMLSIENSFEKESKRIDNQITVSDEKLSQFQTAVDNSNQAMEARLEELERTSKQRIQDFISQTSRRLDERLDAIEQDLKSRSQANKTPVAFLAHTALTEDVPRFEKLRFTTIQFNIGEGFDKSTSVFTAPMRGVYLFSAQVYARPHFSFSVQLVSNGNDIGRTYHKGEDTYSWSLTVVGVALLDAGDEAWVECLNRYPLTGMAIENEPHRAAFKGVLIQVY